MHRHWCRFVRINLAKASQPVVDCALTRTTAIPGLAGQNTESIVSYASSLNSSWVFQQCVWRVQAERLRRRSLTLPATGLTGSRPESSRQRGTGLPSDVRISFRRMHCIVRANVLWSSSDCRRGRRRFGACRADPRFFPLAPAPEPSASAPAGRFARRNRHRDLRRNAESLAGSRGHGAVAAGFAAVGRGTLPFSLSVTGTAGIAHQDWSAELSRCALRARELRLSGCQKRGQQAHTMASASIQATPVRLTGTSPSSPKSHVSSGGALGAGTTGLDDPGTFSARRRS